ncbi:MAG TPA: hypothetical protein VGB98_12235 [Pyrinomonadaceae bacterium]|jgi:hypothetical protein
MPNSILNVEEGERDELDRTIESDVSEVVDEPDAELRAFFRHVYFTARELLQSQAAYQFTLAFTRHYVLSTEAFIIKNVREWEQAGEITVRQAHA